MKPLLAASEKHAPGRKHTFLEATLLSTVNLRVQSSSYLLFDVFKEGYGSLCRFICQVKRYEKKDVSFYLSPVTKSIPEKYLLSH